MTKHNHLHLLTLTEARWVKPVAQTSVDIQQIEKLWPALQLKMATSGGFFATVIQL